MLGTSGSARNERSRLLPPASSTTIPRQDSTLALTSNGWSASSKSPLWMKAASRTSSRSLATRLAPVSTMAESSRCSLDVAVADSMLAAMAIALSSLRSWWPKSARMSSRPTADSGGSALGSRTGCCWFVSLTTSLLVSSAAFVASMRFSKAGRLQAGRPARTSPRPARRRWSGSAAGTLSAPGGRVVADRTPIKGDTDLPECEQLLEGNVAVLQAHHLGHADDLSRAAPQPFSLDDDVDRRRDLRTDRARRKLGARQQHQGLEAVHRITRVVRVQRAHRSVVTRVHRLQHVERLGTAALADDDAVRPHAKAVAHKVSD